MTRWIIVWTPAGGFFIDSDARPMLPAKVVVEDHPIRIARSHIDEDIPRVTHLDGAGQAAQWDNIVHEVGPAEVTLTRTRTKAGNTRHRVGAVGLVVDGLDDYYDAYAKSRIRLPDSSSDLNAADGSFTPLEAFPTALESGPVGWPGRTVQAMANVACGTDNYEATDLKFVDCGVAPPVMEYLPDDRAVIAPAQRIFSPSRLDDRATYTYDCPVAGIELTEGAERVVDGVDVLADILATEFDTELAGYRGLDEDTHVFKTAAGEPIPVTGSELATIGRMTTDIEGLAGTTEVTGGCPPNIHEESVEIGDSDLRFSYGDHPHLTLTNDERVVGAALDVEDPTLLYNDVEHFSVNIEYLVLRNGDGPDSLNRPFDFTTISERLAAFKNADLSGRRVFRV
jgi:hypothetical protein